MAIEINIDSADDIFRTAAFDNVAWSSVEPAGSEILLAPRTEEDDLEEEEDEEDLDDDDDDDDDDEDDEEEEGEDEYDDDEADEIDDEDEDDDEEDHGLITSPERSRRLQQASASPAAV